VLICDSGNGVAPVTDPIFLSYETEEIPHLSLALMSFQLLGEFRDQDLRTGLPAATKMFLRLVSQKTEPRGVSVCASSHPEKLRQVTMSACLEISMLLMLSSSF
jgi:hypothetical protein